MKIPNFDPLLQRVRKWWWIIVGTFLVGAISWWLYWNQAEWAGFYTPQNSRYENWKTLWDWLDLLIVPIVLVIGGWWLNRTQRENEQKIAKDREEEQALQSYFDAMTELLLDKGLLASSKESDDDNSKVRTIARARTLAVLRRLNGDRKASVVHFLHEANVIDARKGIVISLNEADLHGANLREANLSNADLRGANLREAKMSEANLHAVDLRNSNLRGADLSRTGLGSANLSNADLRNVDLRKAMALLGNADLGGADMRGADLREAFLSRINLSTADLRGTDLRKTYLYGASLHWSKIDQTTKIDDKRRLIWDIVNQPTINRDLRGADLLGADLRGADLTGADLSGANLKGVDLSNANLCDVDLSNADLSRADRNKVDERDADLSNAELSGAKYTTDTKWPDGFNPKAVGAINIDEEQQP